MEGRQLSGWLEEGAVKGHAGSLCFLAFGVRRLIAEEIAISSATASSSLCKTCCEPLKPMLEEC